MVQFPRKPGGKKPYKVIYIYSEGEVTEREYFLAIKDELKLSTIHIKPIGTGYHTVSLVKEVIAKRYRDEEGIETEWWVVFDKDSWNDFDEAIALAEKNNIKVAYSNECFELWFLLHYNLLENDIGRSNYYKILTKEFGFNYEKHGKELKYSKRIYPLISAIEKTAHRHAAQLLKTHTDSGVESPNAKVPSTTVHLLVEKLRALKNDGQ